MTETIQTAMDRLMTTAAEPQDYIAEDGLLYCGSCNTPKEAFFPNGRMLFGRDRHPVECQCRQEAREKQEEEERARLHHENVRRLKLQGFTDWAMQHWTFENDHGQNPQMHLAQRYVDYWPEMRGKNVGLLLWGGVGTGKSFMAGCIANALMEQEVAVCMTNFARIMNELNNAGRTMPKRWPCLQAFSTVGTAAADWCAGRPAIKESGTSIISAPAANRTKAVARAIICGMKNSITLCGMRSRCRSRS